MSVTIAKTISLIFIIATLFFSFHWPVFAEGKVLGIHLLSPGEIGVAQKLLTTTDEASHYVTIPLTFDDLNHKERWQNFFRDASSARIIPLIRLATRFEDGAWVIPDRSDIIKMSKFLTSLDWHAPTLTIILFNEPNHGKEWGGKLDPEGFSQICEFAADWFATESKTYVVLPAGMDLAASNTGDTMEAFTYLRRVFAHSPELLDKLDGWTSHSYPNPGFTSDPWKTDKNSLRGYQHELAFLKDYSDKEFPVYITETGWDQRGISQKKVREYYQVAYRDIWSSDSRIKAVTPFLLQGAPGTFAPFSFLDEKGNPTSAYQVYQSLLR